MSQIRPSDIVFYAREVTRVYDIGEVEVHALRGVDLDLFAGELREVWLVLGFPSTGRK